MDDVILAIQSILKNSITQTGSILAGIKKVYYGDPKEIPLSSLPAITIQPKNSQYEQRGTKYDQKKHNIEIRLVCNSKMYFSENPDIEQIDLFRDSVLKVEGSTNYETSNNTICGLVEKNSQLPYNGKNTCQLAVVKNVDYGFEDSRGFNTYESVVFVEIDIIGNR